MGSINCKEYVTVNKDVNTVPSGLYHSTKEVGMDYTDPVLICEEADIQENEMKEFPLNDTTKVLIIKQNGKMTAIGNQCSHYGAPLINGALGNGRVRCPWHGACFNIETGDIEDFPGIDSLPCYKVERSDGKVLIRGLRNQQDSKKRLKNMSQRDYSDNRVFVVVGGGVAGGVCVEVLRQEGFTGRILMVCRESCLPYDRVKISKNVNINLDQIMFRDQEFYDQHDIEVWLGVTAIKLNADEKILSCSNGQDIKFDRLFIATGMSAAKLRIKGCELKNVVTIRDYADSQFIRGLISPQLKVVCLGSSFIALEVAQSLVKVVKSVTVIGRSNFPLEASFGSKIGERVLRLFETNGVTMVMNSSILQIIGNDKDEVCAVILTDNTRIECDLLLMGVGGQNNTDFLRNSGVEMLDDGAIETNEFLQTNIPDIFVGGDIAKAPVYAADNRKVQIGHYQLSQYHARVAALNMVGKITKLEAVPYFFTMLFGKGFRYAGYGKASDIFIDGDIEAFKFVVYFLNGNQEVIAVTSVGRDPVVSQYAELKSQGKRLFLKDIQNDPLEWTQKLYHPDC